MSVQMVRASIGMAIWVAVLTGVLFALNIGRIGPIEGAHFIDSALVCDGEACAEAMALPYHSARLFEDGILTRTASATVAFDAMPDGVQTIYLPKFADTLTVRLNGALLFSPPENLRLWNTPILVQIPPALLQTGDNLVELTITGPAQEGVHIWPFHIGPDAVVSPAYNLRSSFGIGVSRFSMGLMIVLAGALLLIWWNRRGEMHYFWLAASCLSALIFLTHYGFGAGVGSYWAWTLLWPFSTALYVLFILKFLRHLLALPVLWVEKAHLSVIVACATVSLLAPGGYGFTVSLAVNALSAPSAVAVLVILWSRRSDLGAPDFPVFFVCISLAVTLGVYALLLHGIPNTPRALPLFQFVPMVMSFACLYLLLSKFLQSLQGYERLTVSLNQTLDQRTAELEESFSKLATTEKREAIAEERTRIMLDLHDGLGGQLVNTLAYIKSSGAGDETVRLALEDALRDLALMLDSVETHDSLVTLLGMLRTRLEGLLADNGIIFDWQIGEEPQAPFTGPSPNLHLARIVQEAITNVIKHAQASTITVATNERSITIADNGIGIARDAQAGRGGGHGIAGMRQRSARIGATFDIARTDDGTVVTLTFDPQKTPST